MRDGTPDSGSGIKVFSRDDFLVLPSFNHMHRFFSALIRQRGGTVVSVAVGHWSRASGASHYGTLDLRKYSFLSQKGAVLFFKNAAFIFCSTKDVNAVYNGSGKKIFADSGRGEEGGCGFRSVSPLVFPGMETVAHSKYEGLLKLRLIIKFVIAIEVCCVMIM